MSTVAFKSTKWTLDIASRLVRATIRVHVTEPLQDDMAIVFVVNHFTRLETILLPYVLHKHTGREIWSLAADELFKGRIGSYLRSMGTVSTKDPDRDTIMVNNLLSGRHPWIVFPEGAMIKDKKVVDRHGLFRVHNQGGSRPPHTGAAVLALRAEFYRRKLGCVAKLPNPSDMAVLCNRFGLESAEEALSKRTVIVPVNITYYPIRAHDNVILRAAKAMAGNLSPRAVEELSVEGTVLSEKTTIDIRLGTPIGVKDYLDAPEFSELLRCGAHDMDALEADPRSLFNEAARRLMNRYMFAIYSLTTVNCDHVFATLLRHQDTGAFGEQEFRQRAFLAVRRVKALGPERVPHALEASCRDLVEGKPCPALDDFLRLAEQEGWIRRENGYWIRMLGWNARKPDFHQVRRVDLCNVIANEVEPLGLVTGVFRNVAELPRDKVAQRVRDLLVREALAEFEDDYARYLIEGESKPMNVGQPFLLMPDVIQGAVLLIHGYMAAPLEMRATAEHLVQRGYAVYGVRLKGHGTAPEDLAQTSWEAWYDSVARGLALVKTISDKVVVGGFSMGGVLALLAAARNGQGLHAVFSINAPVQLRNYAFRLAPSIVTLNNLLKHVRMDREGWEFVENHPENPHINYIRNPMSGVRELARVMHAMEESLPSITAPLLVLQAYGDPVVNPASAQIIFEKAGSSRKEVTVFEASRHGIVNGDGSERVYEYVDRFLQRTANEELTVGSSEPAGTAAPAEESVPREQDTPCEQPTTPPPSAVVSAN